MKKQNYLELHKEWSEIGKMSKSGLCYSLSDNRELIELFEPTTKEEKTILQEELSYAYWGSGLKRNNDDRVFTYTPMRQNIILLLAAINNQL